MNKMCLFYSIIRRLDILALGDSECKSFKAMTFDKYGMDLNLRLIWKPTRVCLARIKRMIFEKYCRHIL